MQNTKSQIVQKSTGKSKYLCSSYFLALQLYKPSVKTVSWKYFSDLFYAHVSISASTLFMFVDVIDVGGFIAIGGMLCLLTHLFNAIGLPCSIAIPLS